MTDSVKVSLRCPHCGSNASGRVNKNLYYAGKAELKCLVCQKTIMIPLPKSTIATFFSELRQTFGIYYKALKKMGWFVTLLTLAFWILGAFFIVRILIWPTWVALLLPSLPFFYFFTRAFTPIMQSQIKSELGVLRVPNVYRGMNEADPLLVKKPGDEDRIILSRTCPKCKGEYKISNRQLIVPGSRVKKFRLHLFKKPIKMVEQIDVSCKQCDFQGAFFFDISALEIVKKYGYTVELQKNYPFRRK
jgi:predicted nucleic-acid-binding Zn-ribbon protein